MIENASVVLEICWLISSVAIETGVVLATLFESIGKLVDCCSVVVVVGADVDSMVSSVIDWVLTLVDWVVGASVVDFISAVDLTSSSVSLGVVTTCWVVASELTTLGLLSDVVSGRGEVEASTLLVLTSGIGVVVSGITVDELGINLVVSFSISLSYGNVELSTIGVYSSYDSEVCCDVEE